MKLINSITWLCFSASITIFLLLSCEDSVAHDTTVINHIHIETPTPVPDPVTNVSEEITNLSITEGVSASDLAEGIATAAAINHQFDFSYSGWQGSINGAWYEDQNAVSFGLANRFDFMDKALLHGSFTQTNGNSLITVGGTFRF